MQMDRNQANEGTSKEQTYRPYHDFSESSTELHLLASYDVIARSKPKDGSSKNNSNLQRKICRKIRLIDVSAHILSDTSKFDCDCKFCYFLVTDINSIVSV